MKTAKSIKVANDRDTAIPTVIPFQDRPQGRSMTTGIFFVVEGAALVLLGLLAIVIPSIASANVTVVLGWLFLVSGTLGSATTYWARQAPGFHPGNVG